MEDWGLGRVAGAIEAAGVAIRVAGGAAIGVASGAAVRTTSGTAVKIAGGIGKTASSRARDAYIGGKRLQKGISVPGGIIAIAVG